MNQSPVQDPPAVDFEALEKRVHDLEQQLVQAQKLGTVGELTSSIAHEFNNILTTIINYAKLGLRNRDQASRDKAFEKILSAGQRAAKITTGLLAYSRSKGTRRDPHPLINIVSDVLILAEKDLQKHRISLDVQKQGNPYAEVNPGEIQQVLLNLIVNARQAMKPGGLLTVSIIENTQDQLAEIGIRDTGSGMTPDQLNQIFKKFYTTKTADSAGQGGTGLGLSLCKDIVEAHRGRIRVESASGRGTKFTLRFPLASAPNLAAACGTSSQDAEREADSETCRS